MNLSLVIDRKRKSRKQSAALVTFDSIACLTLSILHKMQNLSVNMRLLEVMVHPSCSAPDRCRGNTYVTTKSRA